MRNTILVFHFSLFTFLSFAQNSYDAIIKPRLQVVSNDEQKTSNARFVILENDTLYTNSNNANNLRFLLNDIYADKMMLRYYQRIVFCYLTENPPIAYNLMQWNEPIVIFMDKQFPENIQEDFKSFISSLQMENLEHLNISFTKKLKNSSYHIKATNQVINGYASGFKFDSEADRLKDLLTGSTYNLVTDGNNKFYGGVLQLHLNSFNTDSDITKRLKQLFYKSLGNFVADNYKDTNSLLHDDYDNSEDISEFDRTILRIHYTHIYDQKINYPTFKNLVKLAKKLN